MSLFKLGVASLFAGASFDGVVKILTQYIHMPIWNVPVTVFMAGLAGAGLSLLFGDPIESRRSLWGQVLASAVFGTAVAVMSADAMGWGWAQKNMAMFALMVAALMRWFLPAAIERGKQFIKEFKFSFTKKGGDAPPTGDGS